MQISSLDHLNQYSQSGCTRNLNYFEVVGNLRPPPRFWLTSFWRNKKGEKETKEGKWERKMKKKGRSRLAESKWVKSTQRK
jgi:hypothetical protein